MNEAVMLSHSVTCSHISSYEDKATLATADKNKATFKQMSDFIAIYAHH